MTECRYVRILIAVTASRAGVCGVALLCAGRRYHCCRVAVRMFLLFVRILVQPQLATGTVIAIARNAIVDINRIVQGGYDPVMPQRGG